MADRPQDTGSGTQPDVAPLNAQQVQVHAVQFVGTNVEMTWLIDAPRDEVEERTRALLASKLDLFALTPTGDHQGRPRFSVIASPLDRLFHKIGPSLPLTLIKHASVTQDLTEMNLTRQGQGLMRTEPEPLPDDPAHESEDAAASEVAAVRARHAAAWTAWDAGKLIGLLLRRPALLDHGRVLIAGVQLVPERFPDAILPELPQHAERHGGVIVSLPDALREALRG